VNALVLAELWLSIAVIGGALGTFVLLHYAVDVKGAVDRKETTEGRELAWSRLRLVSALVAGYVTDILLGLAGLGFTFDPALWYVIFFTKALFWAYVIYKSVRMRLMFENVRIGDDEPPATGV
jgi:hypothetical protein